MERLDTDRILITGSTGMIGRYIDFGIKTDSNSCDITDREAVLECFQAHQPHIVIHLAAATDTTKCEVDTTYAYGLNVTGTLNVALAAQAVGAKMIYVSTSRVFSGEGSVPYSERDTPAPRSAYGKSKYIGEQIVAAIMTRYLIVRGCWIFGGGPDHDRKFFGSVLKQLADEKIVALDDVLGSPTYAKDFVAELMQQIALGKSGIVHIANRGQASRAEIVTFMIRYSGSSASLHAVGRDYYETGHLLPTNEAMTSDTCSLRIWQEALGEYMLQEWSIMPKNS
jgi:dTDP-4-dehydrorhamnose reductase